MPTDEFAILPFFDDTWSVEEMIRSIDHVFLTTQCKELTLKSSTGALDRLRTEREYKLTDMQLTRASWNRCTPFVLKVGALVIRPIDEDEQTAFCALLNDMNIARMLVNLPHPIDGPTALRWIDQRRFKGRAGFQLGVFYEDTLVGSIGISALSNALVYFLGRDARGKGYAKQMIRPFTNQVFRRWSVDRIFAGVFHDNPASRRVLENAGFTVIGNGMVKSPARSEEAPFWEMELLAPPSHEADSAYRSMTTFDGATDKPC